MAKVLIADDDPVARNYLGAAVESMGHVVLYSPDGAHAFQTLECDGKIALLITDMAMPGMDGRALIRAVKGIPSYAQMPIAITSGVVSPREIADLLEEGAETFLPKPVRMADLRELISSKLSKR